VEKQRLRGDLIAVYKLLTAGRENIDRTRLFQLDDTCYDTRGHKEVQIALDIRKY